MTSPTKLICARDNAPMNETNVVYISHENERLLCVRWRRIYVGKMFCRESLAVRFVPPKMAGRSCTLQNEGWLLLSRGYSTFHGSHELSINFFAGNWFPRHLLYLNVIKGETVRTLTEESCSQFSRGRLSRRGATAALLYRCDSQETKISYHYLNKLSSFPCVKNR